LAVLPTVTALGKFLSTESWGVAKTTAHTLTTQLKSVFNSIICIGLNFIRSS